MDNEISNINIDTSDFVTLIGNEDIQNKTLYDPILTNYTEKLNMLDASIVMTNVVLNDGTIILIETSVQVTEIRLPQPESGKSFIIIVKYTNDNDEFYINSSVGTTLYWANDTIPITTSLQDRYDAYYFFQDNEKTYGFDLGRNIHEQEQQH